MQAAGSRASKIDAGGTTISRFWKVPAVTGTSGLTRNLNARRAPETVWAKPQFRQSLVCGLEPPRSRVMRSPSTVTVTSTGTGSPPGPSESISPSAW